MKWCPSVYMSDIGAICRGVAVVVRVLAAGERWTRGGLDGNQPRPLPGKPVLDEREDQPRQIRPAAGTGNQNVRRLAGDRQLLLRLQADDCLMQTDMVEHTAERIIHVGIAGRYLTASEMAMPSDPEPLGSFVKMARPDSVSFDGEGIQRAP